MNIRLAALIQAIAVQVCASVLSAFWAGISAVFETVSGTVSETSVKRRAALSALPSTHAAAASAHVDARIAPAPDALGCFPEGDDSEPPGKSVAETLGGRLLSVLSNPAGGGKFRSTAGGGGAEDGRGGTVLAAAAAAVSSHCGGGGGGDAGSPQEAWLCALPSINPLTAAALLSAGRSLRCVVSAVCQVG